MKQCKETWQRLLVDVKIKYHCDLLTDVIIVMNIIAKNVQANILVKQENNIILKKRRVEKYNVGNKLTKS